MKHFVNNKNKQTKRPDTGSGPRNKCFRANEKDFSNQKLGLAVTVQESVSLTFNWTNQIILVLVKQISSVSGTVKTVKKTNFPFSFNSLL